MIACGDVQKELTPEGTFVYRIGDQIVILSPVSIAELEERMGRPILLLSRVGFPIGWKPPLPHQERD